MSQTRPPRHRVVSHLALPRVQSPGGGACPRRTRSARRASPPSVIRRHRSKRARRLPRSGAQAAEARRLPRPRSLAAPHPHAVLAGTDHGTAVSGPGRAAPLRARGDPHGRAAGRERGEVLPGELAVEGRRRRAGAHGPARAAGHGLRRARGPAGGHRPLHLDPVPARLRRLRTLADPGAGAGLVAGTDDRRDDPAPDGRRRRPGHRDRTGIDPRPHGGPGHDPGRCRQAGDGRGPALEADPDRLHERPRPDHRHRSAPQAVRVLRRRGRSRRRAPGLPQWCRRRRDRAGGARGRGIRAPRHPRAAALVPEDPGRPDRGHPVHRRERRLRPRGEGRLARGGPASGLPALHRPARVRIRPPAPRGGGARASRSWP